jgi:hypothetical protein
MGQNTCIGDEREWLTMDIAALTRQEIEISQSESRYICQMVGRYIAVHRYGETGNICVGVIDNLCKGPTQCKVRPSSICRLQLSARLCRT